jgi:hemerythrin superfamily protein
MPDVIKLLEQDHRQVEDLFAKAESNSGGAKQQVVAKLASELTIHAEVEEQFVYPAMREAGLGDLVAEAEAEHQKVKVLVAHLESMDGSTSEVDPLLQQLKRDVEHHVHEEESEAFPKFREACSQETLQGELSLTRTHRSEAPDGEQTQSAPWCATSRGLLDPSRARHRPEAHGASGVPHASGGHFVRVLS